MAKSRSESSRFLSKYAPPGETIYVSDAQYLAEIMVARIAAKDKRHLPSRFWQADPWKKQFLLQLKHANDLLKTFPVNVILKALDHRAAAKVYSLGLKSVIVPLCESEMKRQSAVVASTNTITIENVDVTQKPRKPGGNKGILGKLKNLDNGI